MSDARDEALYVVWSNEHAAWWAPNRCGYTTRLNSAGWYSRKEAIDIARNARDGQQPDGNPNEIAIPLDDAIAQFGYAP